MTAGALSTACVLGLTRPVIAIPRALLETLTSDQLDQVVVHEYAHVQRWDDWARLLQAMVELAFVFHPAVWCLGRAMNLEREVACDDWAVGRWGRRTYASCLAAVARATCLPSAGLVPGMAHAPTTLSRRVMRILDRHRNISAGISWRVVVAGLVGVVTALILVDHWSPRVVFEPAQGNVPRVATRPFDQPRASARAPLGPHRDGLAVRVGVERPVVAEAVMASDLASSRSTVALDPDLVVAPEFVAVTHVVDRSPAPMPIPAVPIVGAATALISYAPDVPPRPASERVLADADAVGPADPRRRLGEDRRRRSGHRIDDQESGFGDRRILHETGEVGRSGLLAF